MIKKLLFSCAIAAVALSANAETKVLWESEEGFTVDWGKGIEISKEDAVAYVKAGDVLKVDVSAVNTESSWPQVQLNANTTVVNEKGETEMLFIACQGGLSEATVLSFQVLDNAANLFKEYGIQIQGDGQTITKISVEPGTVEIDSNTIWFGPRTLAGWGDAISIDKAAFANVKVGDKIVTYYGKEAAEHTLQFLFGGWSGCNIPTYEFWKKDYFVNDEEAGSFIIELTEETEDITWGEEGKEKQYNLISALKEGGLTMHGPCVVNQVQLVPLAETPEDPGTGEGEGEGDTTAVNAIENANIAPVYFDMQGRKIANPQSGNIYIVKKGAKANKVIF